MIISTYSSSSRIRLMIITWTNQWEFPRSSLCGGKRLNLVFFINGILMVIGEAKTLAAAGNVGGANGLLQCQRSIPEMFEPNILCFASEGKVLQLQTVMRTVHICYAKLAEQKVS